jgi:rhamnose transport system permease protein
VLGALFLGVIANALPVVQVSPFWQSAITGTVIVVAVVLNAREGKRAGKQILLRHESRVESATPTTPAATTAREVRA